MTQLDLDFKNAKGTGETAAALAPDQATCALTGIRLARTGDTSFDTLEHLL
nr:hypothetical protein [Pseudomonas sp. s4]